MGASDSKLQFKSRVNQLSEAKCQPNDHEFWSVLFTSQLAVEDIFSLIQPQDVRNLRAKQPTNLAVVIYKCLEQLYLFSKPSNYMSEHTSAKNSLNLLSRILPFVLDHDKDSFVQQFFFENMLPTGGAGSKSSKIKNIGDDELKESLAECLMSTLMQVLFIPGFCVPVSQLPINAQEKEQEKQRSQGYADSLKPSLLWEGGLCVEGLLSPSTEQIQNRVDTLRCILACFTQTLYTPADQAVKTENKFLTIATLDRMPLTCSLLISLLNYVCTYEPSGYLPYTTVLMHDYKEKIVESSLHTLGVLLHYKNTYFAQAEAETKTAIRVGIQDAKDGAIKVSLTDTSVAASKNIYVEHLKNITKAGDIKVLADGFSRLLENIIDANNTYLPSSQKLIPFFEEVLVVFWKLIELNPTFRKHICTFTEIPRFLVPILFIIQQSCSDVTKFPLIQLCCFILLLLSAQREFGVALNKPVDAKTQLDLPVFTGNYADMLILAIHKTISQDKGVVRPLFDCFLTIVCNVSPYCKSLSMVTSSKLVSLFEVMIAPKFLYGAEKHPQFVILLLETFNNLIQYQYEGNVHIVYSILRRKKIFWELSKAPNLTEIKQLLEKKKAKDAAASTPTTPTTPQQQAPASNAFVPTAQWIQSWRKDLPLYTILTLLKTLAPEVESICEKEEMATEEDVLTYLKNTTLVGLLPVPHTIVIRTFHTNMQIDTFLATYLWGMIFLKNNSNPPMFDASIIKLFTVNTV